MASFKLFDAATYNTAQFVTVGLPPLGPGLTWNNKLNLDGTIEVITATATTPPQITGVGLLPDNNFSLSATGAVGTAWSLRATNDLTAPVSTWPVIQSGTISASPFTIDDRTATNYSIRFYRFSAP